jgi:hypothetical protein
MKSAHDTSPGVAGKYLRLACALVLSFTLFVALVLARSATPTTCACAPPPGDIPHYTVADRTNAAEVVLEGTVIGVSDEHPYIYTATVHVHQYFKEQGQVIATVSGFGPPSACLSPVHVGERWVFYAAGEPGAGLRAHYLSQVDAVAPATSEVIAQVIAAVGHDPVLPDGHYAHLPVIFKPTQ